MSNTIATGAFAVPESNFSINVPHGWSADRSGREGSSIVLFSPTVQQLRANVNVVVQDLAPLSQEEYLTPDARLQLRKLS